MQILADASLGTVGGGGGLGPFADVSDGAGGLKAITTIVSSIIGLMTVAAGIWFLIQFIIGGFNWMQAGGDKAKLQSARDKLNNALVGLIVVVAAWAVLALASAFFGVDFTLSSGNFIEQINPGR